MRIILLLLLTVAATLSLAACHSAPKSSSHLYRGDAPNIRYHESHAGGPADHF